MPSNYFAPAVAATLPELTSTRRGMPKFSRDQHFTWSDCDQPSSEERKLHRLQL